VRGRIPRESGVITVFGSADDSCIDRVLDAARELGVQHRFVDQSRLDGAAAVLDAAAARCHIRVDGCRVDLGDSAGVYARPLDVATTPLGIAASASVVEWLDIAEATVVNRPLAMRSNASKPYQGQIIAGVGFDVPDTLVTSSPDEAVAFQRRHGQVIFKSTSGIRSIVRVLDADRIARLELVRSLPVQFQERIEGVDVRVHVVGTRCFATEIVTPAVDYRYASRDGDEVDHAAIDLDAETAARCVAVAQQLELPLCGIDLRRRPNGKHVCFEANPMPAFSYFEANTGQPIARAVVELLAGAA
jgi:glutathione synthase/RimK-type ligase-like ATP-grasp enzyme